MRYEPKIETVFEYLDGAWTLHVLWNLNSGPKRFGEIKKAIPELSGRILTMRLRDLEEKGLISREVIPTSPPSVRYELTKLGYKFTPLFSAILKLSRALK